MKLSSGKQQVLGAAVAAAGVAAAAAPLPTIVVQPQVRIVVQPHVRINRSAISHVSPQSETGFCSAF